MKKVLATILSLCMIVSMLVVPTFAADAATTAGYSEDAVNPKTLPSSTIVDIKDFNFETATDKRVKITDAAGLKKLSELSQTRSLSGYKFYLADNIDCSSLTDFKGIGNGTYRWTGDFYGLGKTIDNLKMSSTGNTVALFPVTGNGGRIYDLKLGSGCSFSGARLNAAIVGLNYGTSYSVIQNIYSEAVVSGSGSNNGGIVGYDQGAITIKNCTVAGSVNGTSSAGGIVGYRGHDGGITGNYTTTISNCLIASTASINGTGTGVGGIVGGFGKGAAASSTINITNCRNDAKVTTTSGYAGGIVGDVTAGASLVIDNCINNGTVKAWTIAGIVGHSASDNVTVTNCENRGKLNTTNSGIKELANGNDLTATSGNNFEYAKKAQYEGYQVNTKYTVEGKEYQDIRFLATIDSENYTRAGFSIVVKDADGNTLKTVNYRDCATAWTSVYATMANQDTITHDVNDYRDGGFFITYTITGVPVDEGKLTFEIQTYTFNGDAENLGEKITVSHTMGEQP